MLESEHVGITASLVEAAIIGLVTGCGAFKRFAYEGWRRVRWQQPERVVEALDLRRGQSVADIGAGGGYFMRYFSAAVGDTGRVYAVDVDPAMIDYLETRVQDDDLHNVSVIAARCDDPLLPEAGVDLIFTSNAYHHIERRPEYFRNLRRYLKPGGRVAIVEHAGKGWFDKWFGHFTPEATIVTEMTAAGFELKHTHRFLERQHFMIFCPGL